MIKYIDDTTYVFKGRDIIPAHSRCEAEKFAAAHGIADADFRAGTMAFDILQQHNSGTKDNLEITFDALASHDITYVGIIQTARATGLKRFPVPYVLTNCHNSLCAVGGTLNEDDHLFGLTAAKKYGGIYVPPHVAVIHSYAREELASCGKMILGSDSHTRYGALGCMAVGEGGPELVKQILGRKYEVKYPKVVAVMLTGAPKPYVGPHDVAIALIGAVFSKGLVTNKVLEFIGEGINSLSVDFRCGIDVMTTETKCLSSIWETDDKVKEYYTVHGRQQDYKKLQPADIAQYDGCITIDLSEIEPMIALPFHPSKAMTIADFKANAADCINGIAVETEKKFGKSGIKCSLMDKLHDGAFYVDQGIIAGCAGGIFENITAASDILDGRNVGDGSFTLNVYPASQSVYAEIINDGVAIKLMNAGAIIKTAFCGPCFGAGDVPANNAFSIRHTTRNFPNREGSKPGDGQISYCALMDARSIAATAANGGRLTGADEMPTEFTQYHYKYHRDLYNKRVYNGVGKPRPETELALGPNIKDWPAVPPLPENLLLRLCSVIRDAVTTTDELIPSGETSTLRSNPYKLSEYTLSRRDPLYVPKAKEVKAQAENTTDPLFAAAKKTAEGLCGSFGIGSAICANMPGDGSAREQAASCQKVLGGFANIAQEYATKRYRSNLINWGILPFLIEDTSLLRDDDFVLVPGIRQAVKSACGSVDAFLLRDGGAIKIKLSLPDMTREERDILMCGGLINSTPDED